MEIDFIIPPKGSQLKAFYDCLQIKSQEFFEFFQERILKEYKLLIQKAKAVKNQTEEKILEIQSFMATIINIVIDRQFLTTTMAKNKKEDYPDKIKMFFQLQVFYYRPARKFLSINNFVLVDDCELLGQLFVQNQSEKYFPFSVADLFKDATGNVKSSEEDLVYQLTRSSEDLA